MSDKDLMIQYLTSMLNPDNNIRNQAESFLLETARKNTVLFVGTSIQILCDSSVKKEVRNISCIVMKKTLTVFEEDPIKGYNNLDSNAQTELQKQLLLILSRETESIVREQMCDLVADLASSIILSPAIPPPQKWPTLAQHLLELFSTGVHDSMIAVFRIFEGLFGNVASHFQAIADTLVKMFEAGFRHESVELNIACLEALVALVSTLKSKELRPYRPFASSMLLLVNKVMQTKNEDNLQVCVGSLYDVCETEPLFLKKHFDDLIAVMAGVRAFDDDPESSLKSESVDCLILMAERYPDLVVNNFPRLQRVVELVFLNMMAIEDDIQPEWASPHDGFNDDLDEDDDQKVIKMGMDFIDRLMIVANQSMLGLINNCVSSMMGQQNWKMHHAALMALSQVGEFIAKKIDSDVPAILSIVKGFAANANPRIRYACCHLLGQFAEDLNPDFQTKFHGLFFEVVLPYLSDPVPRVVAHSLACLTNFLESAPEEVVQPHFGFLFDRICFWLEHGIGYVKESCFSTLAALCESSPNNFKAAYDPSMAIILRLLENSKSATFKQLRGNAIECATIVGKICGNELFAKHYPLLIERMIAIQNSDIDLDNFDPQKSFLMAAWQRIVITIGKDIEPFLPHILPRLMQIIQKSALNQHEFKAKTSETEETEIAVQTIAIMMDEVGHLLLPFIQDIVTSVDLIIANETNVETKVEACKCLPVMLKLFKKANRPHEDFGRAFLAKVWELMDKETDSQTLSEYAVVVQRLIKAFGPLLTNDELTGVYARCIVQLERSMKRKSEVSESFDREEEDNVAELDDMVTNDIELEEEFGREIANVLGSLFKVYKQRALPVFQSVYQTLIVPAVTQNKAKSIHFGLFLIDDAVEHLGPLLPKDVLKSFLQVALQNALSPSLEIRQASLFGIGIISQSLREEALPFFADSMKKLAEAIQLPKKEDDFHKFFESVKDNGVASVGKLIEMHLGALDQPTAQSYLNFWLMQLPVLSDHKEGVLQHQLLAKLVTDQRSFFNLTDPVTLNQILVVFEAIFKKKKVCPDQLKQEIKVIVGLFRSTQAIVAVLSSMNFSKNVSEFIQSV